MTVGPHTEPSENTTLGSETWMTDEVAQAFAEEARILLDEASTLLRELEANPDQRTPLRRLWQIVHTLKGTAGILGQKAVSELAHRMEDLLKALDDNAVALDRRSLGLLFVTVETLEDQIFEGSSPPELPGTLATYDQLLNLTPATESSATESSATAPATAPATESSAGAPAAPAPAPGVESLRVPLARLDGLARLASEISTQRAAFDLRVSDMSHLFDELNQGVTKLARVSQSLLKEYRADRVDSSTGDAHSEFDALEMDRYTEIDVLSQALTEAAGDVETAEGDLREALRGLEGFRDGYAQLTSELQDRLLDARMVPFSSLSARLHRTIRVTARQQAKRVALILEGETIEVDKSVIEEVAEPLLHLMRNAIDHGIEAPGRRRAAGKIEQGEIRVGVTQEGSDVIIRVTDDGTGLDFDGIRQKAIETGLLTRDATEDELGALIFQPGFSTARAISHISGRGVGLDVVRNTVRRLRGHVEVRSVRGQGTTFAMRLPRNLTLTQALLVRAGGESLAIPLSSVDHVRYVEQTEIEGSEDRQTTSIDGESLPVLDLGTALGLGSTAATTVRREDRFPALILRAEGQRLVVLFERILRVEELVVQSAEKLLRRSIVGLSGAALRGDGRVVLVVHPADLLRPRESEHMDQPTALPAAWQRQVWQRQQAAEHRIDVLIVDDSLTVRKVLKQLVEAAGWQATTAQDGVDAWEKLETRQIKPDVVVLDLEMPRMDGFELTTLLRAHDVWRHVPIVILTSRAAQKHRQKALDLGVDAYLVKPYREEDFVSTVRHLISTNRISTSRIS